MSLDRKDSHIEICLNNGIEFKNNSFSAFSFEHDALPEFNKSEIDTTVTLLGKRLSAPLIIGAMTGGTEKAREVNERLALAAAECGVGFALGSQRKMLENPEAAITYQVKKHAPGLPLLFGNIGAVQLNYGVTPAQIRKLISDVQADAFYFHLNPLQEAIQPEGQTNFAGLFDKLSEVVRDVSTPIFVKEVGAGISKATAQKLSKIGFAGIETAGTGGTSWSMIESIRTKNAVQKKTGETFAQWGTPTVESIVHCRNAFDSRIVIASGGIRTGIDLAKSLALGADAGASALPFLKAADESVDAVIVAIQTMIEELKTTMFLTSSKNISTLKTRQLS